MRNAIKGLIQSRLARAWAHYHSLPQADSANYRQRQRLVRDSCLCAQMALASPD
jgi:hypothetical protein